MIPEALLPSDELSPGPDTPLNVNYQVSISIKYQIAMTASTRSTIPTFSRHVTLPL
jgi:hypothetical protein